MHRTAVVVTVIVACTVLALTGCSPSITVPVLTDADVPQLDAAANFPHRTYRIEGGDTLTLKYEFHQEKNQELVVQPDGKIAVAQVGQVNAAGLTPHELEVMLREKMQRWLRNPEVVVTVTRYGEKTVYVGVEVGRPGPVMYRKGLTPLQAIIAVGGFKDGARMDSVILVRPTEQQYISRRLDLEPVVHNGAPERVALAPHDVVFVPRTAIADANLWVKQYITDLLPFLKMPLPIP